MFRTNISRKASLRPLFVFLLFFCLLLVVLLGACSSGPTSDAGVNTRPTPIKGDTSYIPVDAKSNIAMIGMNAVQLTIIGSDTESISTTQLALPYKKEGNKVAIDFGQTVIEKLEIKIPRDANLTVSLASGNVIVDTIQGQLAIELNSGTIKIKNFTPTGKNNIQTKNGTIDVSFTNKSSCNIQAQTDFGAIVSSYPAIVQKRSNMKAEATGTIGNISAVMVNLTAGYGSITIGQG